MNKDNIKVTAFANIIGKSDIVIPLYREIKCITLWWAVPKDKLLSVFFGSEKDSRYATNSLSMNSLTCTSFRLSLIHI